MPDDSRLKSSGSSPGGNTLITDGGAASIKTDAAKRGYLRETFRVFRLSDPVFSPIPVHYHDFHKIILFLSGNSGYAIEGKTWQLAPRDIIFVRAGEIHRPLPALGAPYERIVIYLAPELLSRYQRDGDDLAACFSPELRSSSVMHLPPRENSRSALSHGKAGAHRPRPWLRQRALYRNAVRRIYDSPQPRPPRSRTGNQRRRDLR